MILFNVSISYSLISEMLICLNENLIDFIRNEIFRFHQITSASMARAAKIDRTRNTQKNFKDIRKQFMQTVFSKCMRAVIRTRTTKLAYFLMKLVKTNGN